MRCTYLHHPPESHVVDTQCYVFVLFGLSLFIMGINPLFYPRRNESVSNDVYSPEQRNNKKGKMCRVNRKMDGKLVIQLGCISGSDSPIL